MGITIEEAYALGKTELSTKGDYKIVEMIDIGDSYAICYEPADGSDPIPGDYPLTVKKVDGKIGSLTIPPFENLERLEKGKVVKIPGVI